MTDDEQIARKLAYCVEHLDMVLKLLTPSKAAVTCPTCGFVHQTNKSDYQARQAVLGARNRAAKTLAKMLSGEWEGRTVDAVRMEGLEEFAREAVEW